MEMDDNYYNTRFNELKNQVDNITVTNNNNYMTSFSNIISKNYIYIYAGIPILIFIILIASKPSFIMTEIKDEKTFFIEKKINYTIVIITIAIVLVIEAVYYFITNVKK